MVEVESNQKMLEREVKVKKITVNIDKNKCLPLRAIFKFDMKTKLDLAKRTTLKFREEIKKAQKEKGVEQTMF